MPTMSHGSRFRSFELLATALLALVTIGAGCPSDDVDDGVASMESGNDSGPGSTGTTAADGTTSPDSSTGTATDGADTGGITNACGTFDTDEAGDSVIPQDPDDPEIITACTALCDAMAGVPDCTTDPAACLDTCKLRSCQICPGTLAPLVACETELFDAATCRCGADGAVCSTPEGCSTQLGATGQCGG
jgi:hypothetical protein